MGFPSNPPTRDRPKPLVLGEQRGRNEADPPHQVGGTLVQRERRAERNRRERRETGVDGRKTRRVPGYGGRVESISKLRATLSDFSPANLFLLTPSLRKIHPPPVPFAPPRSLPLPLSFSYHLTFSLSFHQAPVSFLRSLPKVACSSRILISSKVLFPLNRAATRNNALYVRAFLLAFFFFTLDPRPFSLIFRSSVLLLPRLSSASLCDFVLTSKRQRSSKPTFHVETTFLSAFPVSKENS